ncbi:MAG: GNAT family N-acetyltransferase [Bacteroidaceae bacterium]|nr:GNAT family N-acetyltransferase [Bacteroidaceae bacterium]
MACDIKIFEATTAENVYVDAINRLLVQLSSSPVLFTHEKLADIVASSSSHLFFAEHAGEIVGMLTIGEYLAPTGRKVWIEDVVVDEAMRGRSLGRMLVEHAITYSKTTGGGTLMLTSRPSRIAANRLYRSCGFEPKETNMYRMSLDAE